MVDWNVRPYRQRRHALRLCKRTRAW